MARGDMKEPKTLEFQLGEKTRVTDPCYQRDVWCQGEIKTLPGKWFGTVEYSDEGQWGCRVKRLLAWHSQAPGLQHSAETASENSKIHVGVDSGQAGIFDDAHYPKDEIGEYGDPSTFYGKVCDLTLGDDQYGGLEFGIVSSSGYGDGGYDCLVKKNEHGEVVALQIVFISDEDPEEEEGED